jgi:hypothetical protein
MTKQDKVEQIMHVQWETEKSPGLHAFASRILECAERGESDMGLKQQLAQFRTTKIAGMISDPDLNQSCDKIIFWVKKVASGDA